MLYPHTIRRFCALCLTTLSLSVSAQYTVTGTILSSEDEAEPFATLRVYSTNDSTRVAALGTSSDDGTFSLPVDSAGDYRLSVLATGYAEATRLFSVSASQPQAIVGDIVLGQSNVQLDEVSVTAQKPLVSKSIDRIGYDVQADIDATTSPLSDILKRVPMVSVDPDGTIKVKGSTNFKIYKNGRPNNTFSSNAKEIFKSIPASTIKRIEVITDPGARESAEGSGPILNIVTVDNLIIKGVAGNINLRYNSKTDLPTPNVWLMTQIDKVTVSGYAGGNFQHGKRHGLTESEIDRTYTDTGDRLYSSQHNKQAGDMGYWGFEGSWEPDTLNMVTFDTSGFVYGMHSSGETNTTMTASDGSPIYSYTRLQDTPRYRMTDISFGANYQRSTHLKGENITLSYLFELSRNSYLSNEKYTDLLNVPFPYTGITGNSRTRFTEHTVQLDWTRPLGEMHTFDIGAKYINRNNTAVADYDYTGWMQTHSDFTHRYDIAALYADYRLQYKRLGARAGVRYEYSRLSAKFHDGSQDGFGSSFNDVAPNVALSYNASDASMFKLAYSTSISRPGIDYLNPNVVYSPTSQSSGNPDLNSSFYHNIDMSYSLITSRFNLDLSASYNFSNNTIDSDIYTIDNFTYSTYGNVGRLHKFMLSAYFNWTITPKTRWMLNGTIGTGEITNKPQSLSASSTEFDVWTRISQQLPWELDLSASLWWSTGNRNSVYSHTDYHTWGRDVTFTLQRSFLKEKRLQVSLYVRNPWGPDKQRFFTYSNGGGYNERSTTAAPYSISFGATVSYRFGSLNTYVKKTAASISNTDRTSSSAGAASK